jgi:hypothetical protein
MVLDGGRQVALEEPVLARGRGEVGERVAGLLGALR